MVLGGYSTNRDSGYLVAYPDQALTGSQGVVRSYYRITRLELEIELQSQESGILCLKGDIMSGSQGVMGEQGCGTRVREMNGTVSMLGS